MKQRTEENTEAGAVWVASITKASYFLNSKENDCVFDVLKYGALSPMAEQSFTVRIKACNTSAAYSISDT